MENDEGLQKFVGQLKVWYIWEIFVIINYMKQVCEFRCWGLWLDDENEFFFGNNCFSVQLVLRWFVFCLRKCGQEYR